MSSKERVRLPLLALPPSWSRSRPAPASPDWAPAPASASAWSLLLASRMIPRKPQLDHFIPILTTFQGLPVFLSKSPVEPHSGPVALVISELVLLCLSPAMLASSSLPTVLLCVLLLCLEVSSPSDHGARVLTSCNFFSIYPDLKLTCVSLLLRCHLGEIFLARPM